MLSLVNGGKRWVDKLNIFILSLRAEVDSEDEIGRLILYFIEGFPQKSRKLNV